MPRLRCSSSNQPAPSPSSTCPALISSTWATLMASTPGARKVAELSRVPSRILEVSRAIPARVIQASVGPGSPAAPPKARKWSERKKASKPSASARWATASCWS